MLCSEKYGDRRNRYMIGGVWTSGSVDFFFFFSGLLDIAAEGY